MAPDPVARVRGHAKPPTTAYDAGQYLYAPTGGGPSRPADFYGEALIPEGYVRKHYTRELDFVDFVSDPARLAQALIVMQKR